VADSYWLAEEPEDRPRVRLDGPPDVAIVGGGVTGCSCAFALARAGRRVRVYEAREIASGASGRNGGFALRGAAAAYHHACEQLGREPARELWQLTERSLERLRSLAGDAFRPTGSLRLAAGVAEREELVAEYEALREDGFAVEWLDELARPLRGHFLGAILHPPDGSLHPVRWVRRLARRAAEAGAEILEHAGVASLADLDAEHVVIATDGYTRGLLPELDVAVRPTRGQVVTTEPLAESLFPRPHYARDGYDYWQQTPDGRLVVGGRRDVRLEQEYTAVEATTGPVQDALEELIRMLLGRLPRLTHRWAGIFGTTASRLPLVGPVPGRPGLWVACGYSGHGNVLGFACGELVAEAILGRRHAALELFDPGRALGHRLRCPPASA
jgi:gamma-glutamylputrescine oxidase